MNDAALKTPTHEIAQEIVVDEVFPHAPETIWKALTNGELIGRWLMVPTGFEPVKGTHFTFQTTPGGAWDGVIPSQRAISAPFVSVFQIVSGACGKTSSTTMSCVPDCDAASVMDRSP